MTDAKEGLPLAYRFFLLNLLLRCEGGTPAAILLLKILEADKNPRSVKVVSIDTQGRLRASGTAQRGQK